MAAPGAGRDGRNPALAGVFERILVLCVGNLCRSPMAAAILDDALKRCRCPRTVRSAGVAAVAGAPADALACRCMAERGLDLSNHRATALRPYLVRQADLVLVMEEAQRRWLIEAEPAAAGKTYLLGHWTGVEIADPYLQPAAAYEEAIRLIDAAVAEWVERL